MLQSVQSQDFLSKGFGAFQTGVCKAQCELGSAGCGAVS